MLDVKVLFTALKILIFSTVINKVKQALVTVSCTKMLDMLTIRLFLREAKIRLKQF